MQDNNKEHIEQTKFLLRAALMKRRVAIVHGLARRFCSILADRRLYSAAEQAKELQPWARIASLSQLRAEVGGRFQNLREKWTAAGFPLREHRGDRTGHVEFDHDGWLELATWITRQGYEVRLAGETDDWLFEVRKQGGE